MLWKKLSWVLLLSLLMVSCYKFVVRGNNRCAVYWHHGIWLPPSTDSIHFTLYPNFPRILDDWAFTECEVNKIDYLMLLKNQEYKRITRIDTSYDKSSTTTYRSEYQKIPDSLFNKFPVSFYCKSNTGDFLIINTILIEQDIVKIVLYTDWN